MSFGERLKQRRIERGLSQAALAERLGTSKQVISRYETGLRTPKITVARQCAEILGVPLHDLMGIEAEDMRAAPAGFVPRLGAIACGAPILAQDHILGYDRVPEGIRCDFTLVCQGDSMIEARIRSGDIVYIRSQSQVENGQIAAVRIADSATLKRVYYTPQGLLLQPANSAYSPVLYEGSALEDVEVIGLAVGFTSTQM